MFFRGSALAVSVEQPTHLKTHRTLDITCFAHFPLVDASGQSNHIQTDLTASTPEPHENQTVPKH